MERIVSLLLIAALTLFNEAGSFPLQLPSVFHNPLDEEEAEKFFCIEKESIEERSEEDHPDHWRHDSGGADDIAFVQQGLPAIGQPLPLHSFYDSVFQSITDRAAHLLGTLVGRPFYILFHAFKAFLP
ncbi:MAG TPA: hypothetical protein PK198_22940 [Saprospiraceae bacterium]|nr:hypothetical protein [Saprospiraceae bacterium]HRJ14427.1 hypothetical protein [Saprospiraceae bacterium]HRK82137.1 hypothetical protein [Saprospiraceae bacterium]